MMIDLELQRHRSWISAIAQGFQCRCPECGKAPLLSGYLSVRPACLECGTELHHQRADDAPPYITIFAVGHIIIPLLLLTEKLWHPDIWIHFVVWLPLTLILTLWLLPRVKGAIIGLQWALRLHGFGDNAE
jgi:uncharacterized protein (DUF983 family)